jgi:uncharacterized protein
MNEQEERNWAMGAHLSALSGLIIPFGNLLGPLVIWLTQKEKSAFVEAQAKEALNFNITVFIAAIVCGILTMVLIGLLLLPIVGIAWLVLSIIAGIKASKGEQYQYPFTLRLVK